MKYIYKKEPPELFQNWIKMEGEEWSPTWNDLQSPEKPVLHETLLNEQGYVCCYCGRRIEKFDSHIEHFRPRQKYPQLELCYSNLHASCQRKCEKKKRVVCGQAKENWFDENYHVNPQDVNCEKRFRFQWDGYVQHSNIEDVSASKMIEILNLNEPILIEHRNAILEGAITNEMLVEMSEDEIEHIGKLYRQTDNQDNLPNLGHVVARAIEDLLGKNI